MSGEKERNGKGKIKTLVFTTMYKLHGTDSS